MLAVCHRFHVTTLFLGCSMLAISTTSTVFVSRFFGASAFLYLVVTTALDVGEASFRFLSAALTRSPIRPFVFGDFVGIALRLFMINPTFALLIFHRVPVDRFVFRLMVVVVGLSSMVPCFRIRLVLPLFVEKFVKPPLVATVGEG